MKIIPFLAALAASFFLSGMPSTLLAATQGFRECTELCYMKECGQVGVKCPTQTQKTMYRRLCYGRCKEKIRRQRVAEMLRIERERAARYRQQLILKHKLWLEKKRVTHQIRLQYLKAKQQRQSRAAQTYYRRMLAAMQDQIQVMNQKLQMKESFYDSRRKLREKQRAELLYQMKQLKRRLALAQKSKQPEKVQELKKKIVQYKKKELTRNKQAAKLKVDYLKTRIQRRKQEVKQIKVEKKRILQTKMEAKKKKDQKKLDALAKRLGELAGQQAAVTKKADLERIKLQQARAAYMSASRRTL